MRSYLISDNRDTQLGMRIAGISGVIVHEREEILKALDQALQDSEIGIIIITEKILEKVEDEVMELKLKRTLPLIVTIPDRHGFQNGEDFITKYIRESIGIKI